MPSIVRSNASAAAARIGADEPRPERCRSDHAIVGRAIRIGSVRISALPMLLRRARSSRSFAGERYAKCRIDPPVSTNLGRSSALENSKSIRQTGEANVV